MFEVGVFWILILLGAIIALFSDKIDAAARRGKQDKRARLVGTILLLGGLLSLLLFSLPQLRG